MKAKDIRWQSVLKSKRDKKKLENKVKKIKKNPNFQDRFHNIFSYLTVASMRDAAAGWNPLNFVFLIL